MPAQLLRSIDKYIVVCPNSRGAFHAALPSFGTVLGLVKQSESLDQPREHSLEKDWILPPTKGEDAVLGDLSPKLLGPVAVLPRVVECDRTKDVTAELLLKCSSAICFVLNPITLHRLA